MKGLGLLSSGAFALWLVLRLFWRGPMQVLGVTLPEGLHRLRPRRLARVAQGGAVG